jgi:hypothetical protein
MSTQRREDRWQRTSCTASAGASKAPGGGVSPLRWRVPEQATPSSLAQYGCADATVGTAPPGFSARTATISLQTGYRIVQLVLQELRHGTPPFWAGCGAETGTPANHGSSLPHIPDPSCPAPLHRTLPQVPAARRPRAERYDGKGNMYLKHAA